MSKWIEWNGGVCPVGHYTPVEVQLRVGGISFSAKAGQLRWENFGLPGDIIAYRIIEVDNNAGTSSEDYLENFRAAIRQELSKWRDPKQIDGEHYTNLVIQPLDVAYLNDMNSGRTKVCKYVMRSKNGIEDLRKAKDMVCKVALYEYGVDIDND